MHAGPRIPKGSSIDCTMQIDTDAIVAALFEHKEVGLRLEARRQLVIHAAAIREAKGGERADNVVRQVQHAVLRV